MKKSLNIVAAVICGLLGSCGDPPSTTSGSKTATSVKKVTPERVQSVATLSRAGELCKGVPSYGDDPLIEACNSKLKAMITEEVLDNGGLAAAVELINENLKPEGSEEIGQAAQSALRDWLKENGPKENRSSLFRWRDEVLPQVKDDPIFIFQPYRDIINEQLKEK